MAISTDAQPTREQVFSAIFDRLKTAPGFTKYSRRMIDYSVIPPGIMPICILWEQPEESDYGTHQRIRIDHWHALVVIFFQNDSRPQEDDPTTAIPGATIINPLVDAVNRALGPDDGQGNLTLRDADHPTGLVQWVRIEGTTVIETGDTDSAGIGGAMIPLRILVP
jgi:hypothetical protein